MYLVSLDILNEMRVDGQADADPRLGFTCSSASMTTRRGIHAGNARACTAQGAVGVAVVSAVLSSVDPRRALLSLLRAVA